MGDYFGHWLSIGENADAEKLPRIFYVNWFRKDDWGNFVWPGYGENSRVLKWIIERLEGTADATKTAIGNLPTREALNLAGLDIDEGSLELLLTVDHDVWAHEAPLMRQHLETFGEHLPKGLWEEFQALLDRLALHSS
jgi:phosphoenolpyruvate carboxykinase (GTP)